MNYEIVFDNGFWERIATFENKFDAKASLKFIKKNDIKKDFSMLDYKIRRIKKNKRTNMQFEIVFTNESGGGWEKIAECESKEDGKLIIKAAKKIDKKDKTNNLRYKILKIKKSKK